MRHEPRGATPAGTQSYFESHSLPVPPVIFGKTGWRISPVGFGGYRIQDRDPVHREALRLALLSGCNLIDTSANYGGNGASEILVGQVLRQLFEEGLLRRDQVVVVTKAGYIQGDNLAIAEERLRDGDPFPEVVQYQPGLWHCISPEFLEDQISRSLNRLGLPQLDVLLLHNPEYFLAATSDHPEYYRRIRAAFAYLESEVERGRIQYYGISSNTFPATKEDAQFTSLEAVLGTSGFAAIQFPFNLFEPGAVLEENNGGKTLVQLAREQNLGTLVNRPLNARHQGRMLRLAEFPVHDPELTRQRIQNGVAALVQLESSFPLGSAELPEELSWGHVIRRNFNRLEDLETWKSFLAYRIRPSLAAIQGPLAETERPAEETKWLAAYTPQAESLFEAITHHLENHAAVDSDRVSRTLLEAAPELGTDSPTLSQKVLRIYRAFPGIHCILVGMRRPEYVRDVLALPPPLSESVALRALERIELLR